MQSEIHNALETAGYIDSVKITNTLQGSVWRSIQKSTNKHVVTKVTDQYLHKNRITVAYPSTVKVSENIKKEISILKRLSKDAKCPKSITKYIDSFKSNSYYFLVMEDGECSLFDFVEKVHRCIANGIVDIVEWHKMAKIILKQMIECVEYIHSKNVCHFDISLENFLINDVDIQITSDDKMHFRTDSVQIKLCDFGLAEVFGKYSNFKSNKYCGKKNYQSPEIRRKQIFSAKSNDIWCLGVGLFMLIIGSAPWNVAAKTDGNFIHIMNGNIVNLLISWKRLRYTNDRIIDIFQHLFQFEEEKRMNLNELKCCEWLVSV